MNIQTSIDTFEKKILEALEFKYRHAPSVMVASMIEESPVTRINIAQFCELYRNQNLYPAERLDKLVYQLMDIKIQMFYIWELDTGLYNRLICDMGFSLDDLSDCPYMALRKLSIDQNLIMKGRVLWERIMNFVYYLETGKDLEVKKSSKKTRFFKFISGTKWSFLDYYMDYVNWFDDSLRTPEVHKDSTLRARFMGGDSVPFERITALSIIVVNVFWECLMQVVQGKEVHGKFWCKGMDVTTDISSC